MGKTEVELMSECSPLYASFALESFANTCLGLFFVYLSVLITSKGKLKTPGRSAVMFIAEATNNRYNDVMSIVNQWPNMPNCSLEKRFRLCRKVNATICQFSALVSLLAVTRWLHINNVNGFRYLGYSLTCPPMQAEILVLIAPVVPCYKFFVKFSAFMTWTMLITGWIASCLEGDLWTNPIMEWAEGGFESDLGLTNKGWLFVASCIPLVYLTLFQLPMVLLLYFCHGGAKSKAGLPEGFPRMVCLVWVTWMCFPLWWSISYEGFKLINDTKMNGIGFVCLNVVSKGGFTLSILRMVRFHKQKGIIPNRQESRGEWLGFGSTGDDNMPVTEGAEKEGDESEQSNAKMKQTASQLSGDAWFTSILGKYEQKNAQMPQIREDAGARQATAGPTGLNPETQKAVASQLQALAQPQQPLGDCKSQVLMDELVRRLAQGELKLVGTGSAAGAAAGALSGTSPRL
eukprot:CAMPEP_0178434004 /NCGR_PEP_ID=MMETSP0689_2-20121128/33199_1 /TAXON_ID=160604 /ORGANISM="Amphidinium massartii, Strain CS-259" /LENGTH=459 /DNA_ID=CAMNT_0020056053 /DNA_START=99 /DNA_END=1478 /DNA_ORIENTATION=-